MNTFLNNPVTQAIGWALLHFIWQGALLAAVLLLTNLTTKSPKIRYATGCAVILLMPAVFFGTILRSDKPVPESHAFAYTEPLYLDSPTLPATGRATLVAPAPTAPTALPLTELPGWITCAWLIGLAAFSLFTAAGWLRIQKLTRRGTQPVNESLQAIAKTLKHRLKISTPVRLCISAIAEVPTVIGWLRPCILIPISAITGLDEPQLQAILGHELAHVRRHDYLINLLQNVIEALLFYHPAVWWVSRQIRQERENCCDDLAVEVCGDVMLYATALTQLEEQRSTIQPALAATGGDLLARIRRLMHQPNHRSPQRIAGSIAALTAAAIVLAALFTNSHTPAIHAQSPSSKITQPAPTEIPKSQPPPIPKPTPPPAPRPEFEVASIRPAEPLPSSGGGVGRAGGSDGGGNPFHCGIQRLKIDDDLVSFRCVQLRGLIEYAFGIGQQPGLLTGPDWLTGQRFDVEAKMPQGATKAQVPAMFRSLLEDRFKLTVHRAALEQLVIALLVDKSGPKLKSGSPDTDLPVPGPNAPPCMPQNLICTASIRNIGGEQVATTPLTPGIVRYTSPSIGTALVTHQPGASTTHIEAPDTTVRGLAFLLPGFPVDMTGLTGRYQVDLEYSVNVGALVDQAIAESPAAQAAQAAGPQGPNPAIDAALQRANTDIDAALQRGLQTALLKLGLRLEQRKAPIDTLIVDQVEKLPTDN